MAKQKIPTQQIAKDDKALEAALSMVNKQFGEGSLVRLGDATKMNVETISTAAAAFRAEELLKFTALNPPARQLCAFHLSPKPSAKAATPCS